MFKMILRVIFCQLFYISLFARIEFSSSIKTTEFTLPIQERIAILKSKIAAQVNHPFPNDNFPTEKDAIDENVEYEDHENDPITPINERDPRKKKELFKLKQIKTTRAISQGPVSFERNANVKNKKVSKRGKNVPRNSNNGKEMLQPIIQDEKKLKKAKKSKITDIFYRRLNPYDLANDITHWTHCQDLITPFLAGHKSNMTVAKRVTSEDHVVLRLLQLLSEDTTGHSKEDITSILYQISNLQLRLFQWDMGAIKLLLDVIYKDVVKRHTFKTVKQGLKNVFNTWNLDVGSNITILLKQTRLFRPPCIKITANEGSTKTSKTIRYSKRPKKKCSAYGGHC